MSNYGNLLPLFLIQFLSLLQWSSVLFPVILFLMYDKGFHHHAAVFSINVGLEIGSRYFLLLLTECSQDSVRFFYENGG